MQPDGYGIFDNDRAIKMAALVFDRALRDIASQNRSVRTLSHERVLAVGAVICRLISVMPVPLKFDGKIREYTVRLYDRLQSDHVGGAVYRKYRRPSVRRRIALRVIRRLETIIGENF